MDYTATNAVLGLLALLALAGAGVLAWRWTWFLGWLKGMVITTLVVFALIMVFLIQELLSFNALQEGQPIAHISIEQRKGEEATVRFSRIDRQFQHDFLVYGDYLSLSYRLLEWRGPLGWLGTAYQPGTIGGRYDAIEKNLNWKTATAPQPLLPLPPGEEPPFNLWKWFKANPSYSLAGTRSVTLDYVPLVNGALYSVAFEDGQLVLEPVNDAAKEAGSIR